MKPQRIGTWRKGIEMCIIYFSPILGVIVLFLVQKESLKTLFIRCVFLLILSGAFYLALKANDFFYLKCIRYPAYFFGCYFLSFFWLGLNGSKPAGCLWLLLVVFSAVDSGMELALLSDVFLMAEYAVLFLKPHTNNRYFIAYFILGILFSVLFSLFQKRQEAVYLLFILFMADAVLQTYVYGFRPENMKGHAVLITEEFLCLLALVSVGWIYVRFLSAGPVMKRVVVRKRVALWPGKEMKVTEQTEERTEEQTEERTEEQAEEQTYAVETEPAEKNGLPEDMDEPVKIEKTETLVDVVGAEAAEETESPAVPSKSRTLVGKDLFDEEEHVPREEEILQKILQPDFYLLKKLRQFSPRLYEHSQKISALAGGAARIAGGDELLARAGGMYHEIGRMEPENNYISAGENFGLEAGFPEKLLDVMRQHSPTYEMPKSLEAVVVMLSDSIISTGEYLIKNGQRAQVSDEHLIENIFQNRISKGNLSEVSLSEQEIQTLKDYFVRHVAVAEKSLPEENA